LTGTEGELPAVPPPTRAARSGEIFIAYTADGAGPPNLIVTTGRFFHLEIARDPLRARHPRSGAGARDRRPRRLHTGECELIGDDVGGIAVHIAARVAIAGPHPVLVSSAVRDLVTGSGLGFTDRGMHDLRGLPEQWRPFAVED
jgi:hypothetical protein